MTEQAEMSENHELELNPAGFLLRYFALACDLLLTGTIFVLLIIGISMIYPAFLSDLTIDPTLLIKGDGTEVVFFGLASLLPFVFLILYGSIFEGARYQATPGKLLLGLSVSDINGKPLLFIAALRRNILKVTPFALIPGGLTLFFLLSVLKSSFTWAGILLMACGLVSGGLSLVMMVTGRTAWYDRFNRSLVLSQSAASIRRAVFVFGCLVIFSGAISWKNPGVDFQRSDLEKQVQEVAEPEVILETVKESSEVQELEKPVLAEKIESELSSDQVQGMLRVGKETIKFRDVIIKLSDSRRDIRMFFYQKYVSEDLRSEYLNNFGDLPEGAFFKVLLTFSPFAKSCDSLNIIRYTVGVDYSEMNGEVVRDPAGADATMVAELRCLRERGSSIMGRVEGRDFILNKGKKIYLNWVFHLSSVVN